MEIFTTIDTSVKEDWVNLIPICEAVNVYEYVVQPEDNERLTFSWYHSWICTDTKVGIGVYYLDGNPVCVSYKPYRKFDEQFYWVSESDFKNVSEYLLSLIQPEEFIGNVIDDETLTAILEKAKAIDYKQHEQFNLKTA
jgi:hypothetical protein